MPDGLASVTIDGVDYILTPNEGDAREWADYSDIVEKTINNSTKKVELVKADEFDGLDTTQDYMFGGRSFSIFKADTMTLVYDSGAAFEKKIAEHYPSIFNSNHKELGVDGRSNKKGPEPEDIKTLKLGNKTYAFIGLERAGGLMMYDISQPNNSQFVDYLNIRNMQEGSINNGSDLGAEGICVIEAKDSPTGYPMILVANEVSGTVSVMYIHEGYMSSNQQHALKLEEKIDSYSDEINKDNLNKIKDLLKEIDATSQDVLSLLSQKQLEKIKSWRSQVEKMESEKSEQNDTKKPTVQTEAENTTQSPNQVKTFDNMPVLTTITLLLGSLLSILKLKKKATR